MTLHRQIQALRAEIAALRDENATLRQPVPSAPPKPRHGFYQPIHEVLAQAQPIIQAVLAAYPGLTWEQLQGPRRPEHISLPRRIALALVARHCPDITLAAIGQLFGQRDPDTVRYACRTIADDQKYNPRLDAKLTQIRASLPSLP